jgi:hypothetical protein
MSLWLFVALKPMRTVSSSDKAVKPLRRLTFSENYDDDTKVASSMLTGAIALFGDALWLLSMPSRYARALDNQQDDEVEARAMGRGAF